MNRIGLAIMLCVFTCTNPNLFAQDKPKTEEKADTKREITPLRLQVVIAEYDGEKKISNLPYTLLVNAGDTRERGSKASIRMGLRVPIATSQSTSSASFQYQDVGTNLDAWANRTDDGRFSLHLSVERSSTYSSSVGHTIGNAGSEAFANQPVIQSFRSEVDVLIRDGQTIQTNVATDPVSGRVTKVEVTANVLK
jgi:hypothetical protein